MTLKIAAIAVLALTAAGWAGGAQAQSFNDFMTLCGSTDVEEAAVRSAGEKLGWVDLPDEIVKSFADGADPEMPIRPRFMMTGPDGQPGILAFATSEMPLGGGNAPAEVCMLLSGAIASDQAHEGLEALNLAALYEEDSETGAYMLFSRTARGVRDEGALNDKGDDAIAAALRDRPIYLMGYIPGPEVILVKARFTAPGTAPGAR